MSLNGTMRGVVWEGNPYHVAVTDLPIPTLQASTDAIVRIKASAICRTDLHTYHGVWGSETPPWTMGHEGMGVIAEIGNAIDGLHVGDYVVIPDIMESGHYELEPMAGVSPGSGPDFGHEGGCQCT